MSARDVTRQELRGRAIMVTRARAQSEEITAQIEGLEGTVVHCPTVECVGPIDPGPLDSAIERLDAFDWILFTSANAVTFFCNRVIERHPDGLTAMLSHVICAIGPATARVLTTAGLEVDIVASESTSEGVLAVIIEFAGGPESLVGVRFLMPRARIAREILPTELSRLGAHIETVEAYQTVRPAIDGQKIIGYLTDGEIDAITFTSPSTVSNFASLVGTKDLSSILRGTLVACIGPVTAAAALAHGIQQWIEPEKQTAAALVDVIARSLAEKDR